MKTTIVDSWTKVPFIGMQIWKFNSPKTAFDYAEREYAPYGYNVAFFSTDTNTLYLTQS